MTEQPIDILQLRQIQAIIDAAVDKALAKAGLITPYISLKEDIPSPFSVAVETTICSAVRSQLAEICTKRSDKQASAGRICGLPLSATANLCSKSITRAVLIANSRQQRE